VTALICGVDVAATTLEARIGHAAGPGGCFGNNPDGIAELAAFCHRQGVTLVALEATGGYEKLPFGLLWGAGVPVAIVNPRAVRRFAEAMGVLEKTDRLDAGVIAWYAETRRLTAQPPASDAQARLSAWVTRLRQLTELRTAQTNQRRLVEDPTVRALSDELLALLARQLRQLEAEIASLIAADPLWAALDASFRSLKGVAGRTTARLMADMPEIGTLSGKAAAKLAGLAPLAHDSGKARHRRTTRAGRPAIRTILFVVAEIVRRYDPDFQAFHHRLSAAGKPKKVIRVALAHKLLTRLNAKARDVRQAFANAQPTTATT
jgi:transposase